MRLGRNLRAEQDDRLERGQEECCLFTLHDLCHFFSPNARKGERRGAGGKRKIDARGDVGGRRAEGVKTEDERIR